jgi:hypothetical protein
MRLIDAAMAPIYLNESACDQIKMMPTIDAVSVVRCRECKYGKESKISFDCDGKTSLCECPHIMLIHQWDEYCSFGERKRISHEE